MPTFDTYLGCACASLYESPPSSSHWFWLDWLSTEIWWVSPQSICPAGFTCMSTISTSSPWHIQLMRSFLAIGAAGREALRRCRLFGLLLLFPAQVRHKEGSAQKLVSASAHSCSAASGAQLRNRLPFWGSHERVCRENPSKPVLPGQAGIASFAKKLYLDQKRGFMAEKRTGDHQPFVHLDTVATLSLVARWLCLHEAILASAHRE